MNLQQLEYFKNIAETKSFTLAAKNVHVTQPALSKAISKLEEELGVTLFKREGKNIKFTKYGEIFFKYIDNALNDIADGIKEIENMKKQDENSISIASTSCIGNSFIPSIISDFLNFYSNAKFQFANESTDRVLEDLNDNKIDIGFFESISDIKKFQNVEFREVMKEKYVIVVSKNHSFSNKNEISLKDLKDEFFIVSNEYKDKLISCCKKIGYIPKISVEPKETNIIGSLVSAGAGVAIISNASIINTNKISILDIKEDIGCKTIYMGWNNKRNNSEIIKNFKEFITKVYR